jgi:16S rRNA (uracil1498-N3)-methyltransferase
MRSHKLIRIFVSSPLAQGDVIGLNKEQSHYLIMSCAVNNQMRFCCLTAKMVNSLVKLYQHRKNAAEIKLGSQTRAQKSSPDITLLYAPVKNAKNEFIVQKATKWAFQLFSRSSPSTR